MMFPKALMWFALGSMGCAGVVASSSWIADDPTPVDRSALEEDFEVMSRLLTHEISQKSEEISGSNTLAVMNHLGLDLGITLAGGDSSGVFDDFLQQTRGDQAELEVRADYLRGYGACFTLTVPIKSAWTGTALEEEQPQAGKTPNRWEKMEQVVRGESVEETTTNDYYELAVSMHQVLDSKAVSCLRDTIVSALHEFGGHLDLTKDEWISVAVELHSSAGISYGDFDVDGDFDIFVSNYGLTLDGVEVGPSSTPSRLVIQTRVANLAMSAEEFAKAAIVELY